MTENNQHSPVGTQCLHKPPAFQPALVHELHQLLRGPPVAIVKRAAIVGPQHAILHIDCVIVAVPLQRSLWVDNHDVVIEEVLVGVGPVLVCVR